MRVPAYALLALLLFPGYAFPACPAPGSPLPPVLKPGPIADRWFELQCDKGIGHPVAPERRHLWSGGVYQDFERGQIAVHPRWAGDPSAKMGSFVLSAFATGETIHVKWQDTAPFGYDFFNVRWDRDSHAPDIEKQHEPTGGFLGLGSEDPQQKKIDGAKTRGETDIPAKAAGTYIISVQGCDDGGFLGLGSDCHQGWSFPVEVDQFLVTLPHLPPVYPSVAPFTAPPYDLLDGPMLHPKQIAEVLKAVCLNPQDMVESEGDHERELKTDLALAALRSIRDTPALFDPEVDCAELHEDSPPKLRTRKQLQKLVNDSIRKSKVVSQPGTDSGFLKSLVGAVLGLPVGGLVGGAIGFALAGPGGVVLGTLLGAVFGGAAGFITGPEVFDPGDYDMRLVGLVQIAYLFPDLLDDDARNHLLDDLLTARGGAGERREYVWVGGIPTPIPESENHILMTESSRYLTNQLIAERFQKDNKSVPKEFDNDQNGMTDWMLEHLQSFVRQDFFEYNARPYAFYAMQGISNLYEFAGPTLLGNPCWQSKSIPPVKPIPRACHVRRGARIVMDYNAARFALATLGLRRASPNRRQPEQRDYTRLLGRQSDSATWRYLTLTGGTDLFWQNRYGRIPAGAQGDMLTPILGSYRVPRLIVDLMSDKPRSYFQRFYFARDEDYPGTELYHRDPNFLISAGGIYDGGRGNPFTDAEHAWARATTLMPLAEGLDYNHFVRIAGSKDHDDRVNTCIAPGFACGLNPTVPSGIPEACVLRKGNWTFIDFNALSPGCVKYGFMAVVYSEACDSSDCESEAGDGGTFGFFEAAPYHALEQMAEDVIAKNKSWDFRSDQVNVYEGASGRRYTFQPMTSDRLKWGMVSIAQGTAQTDFPTDIAKWPLAEGEVMRTNGHQGCVTIDHAPLDQRLVLDYTDAHNPKRARVSLSGGGVECRCPLPDSCLPPRHE